MTNKLQKIFFLFLFSLGFSQLNAATFEVEKFDEHVTFRYDEEESEPRSSNIYLKTSSTSPISVVATCYPSDLPPGVTYSICTPTNCLPGKTDVFTFPPFDIDASSMDVFRKMHLEVDCENLNAAIIPEGGLNFSFKVVTANVNNAVDKVEINIKYTVTNTSSVIEQWVSSSEVSPNPAMEFVNISFKNNLNDNTIRIYNELGVEVMSQAFNGNKVSLETNALNNGRYFFKVENSSKVIDNGNFIIAR